MDLPDVPVWAQSVGGIIGFAVTTGWLALREKRGEKAAAPTPVSEAQVVAASFVDKRLLGEVVTALTGLHGSVNVLNGHVEKLNERMHEQDMLAALAAKMRDERR